MYFSTYVKAVVAVVIAALLAGPLSVAAPPEGKGNAAKAQKQKAQQPKAQKVQKSEGQKARQPEVQKTQKGKGKPSAATVSGLISASDAHRLAVTHNYVGYQPLPPGIRKKLARGEPLPPGIAKKQVPPPMLAQLPARTGYEWRIYGRDLVLVAVATAIVADVLLDVFE